MTTFTNWSKLVLGYRDNNGDVGKTSFWLGVDGGGATPASDISTLAASIETAVSNMTTAKISSVSGFGWWVRPDQYGTGAQYASTQQKARLICLSSDYARRIVYEIPAPVLALFYNGGSGTLGDEKTINPAASLITAFLAVVTTASGSAAVVSGPQSQATIHSLVRGSFVEHRGGRKITIWKKTPDGTGPA